MTPTGQRDSKPVHRKKTDCSNFSAKLKAMPTHSRTVTISEATQIEPTGSWPWESGFAIQLRT